MGVKGCVARVFQLMLYTTSQHISVRVSDSQTIFALVLALVSLLTDLYQFAHVHPTRTSTLAPLSGPHTTLARSLASRRPLIDPTLHIVSVQMSEYTHRRIRLLGLSSRFSLVSQRLRTVPSRTFIVDSSHAETEPMASRARALTSSSVTRRCGSLNSLTAAAASTTARDGGLMPADTRVMVMRVDAGEAGGFG